MVLEMKRALEELKKGDNQGYRRLYDATYEEVYCRALLIIQREDYALDFIKDFYKEIFGVLDEAEDAVDTERWFLHRYYQKLRKHYHRLLGKLEKTESEGTKTLAEIPATFPLLHRIMLVMSFKDDFSAAEISGIYGLAEDKIQSELEKLEKLLPSITKDQPDSVEAYLGNWKVLLLGASRQITNAGTDHWVDAVFADAAKAAGVSAGAGTKKDDFEYFVADPEPEPEPEKPKKKIIPIVKEEPEEDDEEEDDDEAYDDEEEDDEYDDDEDEDDRYDWDMEDDGRKMIILGIILAVIIVAVVGIAAFKLLGKDSDGEKDQVQSEQNEDDDNKLIVKGGEDGSDEDDSQEPSEEESGGEPEEEPVEEPEEPEQLVMRVNGNSINVRSEPNTSSNILTKVKKDDKVEVLGDPSGEWVQIRCIEQNNEEGYMMSQYLSNIE